MAFIRVNSNLDISAPNDGMITLREALKIADGTREDDTIVFAPELAGTTIALSGEELVINAVAINEPRVVTIQGDIDGNGTPDITIDAGGQSRALAVVSGDANLDGLIVTGGDATMGSNVGRGRGADGIRFAKDGIASDSGGGLFLNINTDVTLTNSLFEGNFASSGGAIRTFPPQTNNGPGTILIDASTFRDNESVGNGGALSIGDSSVYNSTFENNSSGQDGGAILINGGTISNSTFVGNSADRDGGAIKDASYLTYSYYGYVYTRGDLYLSDSTITGNTAGQGYGGIITGERLVLTNTLILGNSAATNPDADLTNALSVENSIIGGDAATIFDQTVDGAGVLGNNGGPVQTVLLRNDPSNPALDAAPATGGYDARGIPRDINLSGIDNGGVRDLGAVELPDPNAGPTGTTGDDILLGSDIDETIFGLAGTDVIAGRGGIDVLDGGDGDNDALDYRRSSEAVSVNLGSGAVSGGEAEGDTISGFERILGSRFDDVLTGDGGRNTLVGLDGDDTLNGGGGDDILRGRVGADALDGGAGTADVADYELSPDAVTVSLTLGTGIGGDADGDTLTNIEVLLGSAFGDDLEGGDGDDLLIGGAGADVLRASAGADRLEGGSGGGDVLDYGGISDDLVIRIPQGTARKIGDDVDQISGFEIYRGGIGNDDIVGSSAREVLRGGLGDDVIKGGGGGDTLDGGAGLNDTLDYSDITRDLTVSTSNAISSEGDTIMRFENVLGGSGDDLLTGDNNDNKLIGGDGDDVLRGAGGDDRLVGGDGRDKLIGASGADIMNGGDGDDDLADYALSAAGVTVRLGIRSGFGGQAEGDTLINIENVTGSRFDDFLAGNDADNLLVGGAGDDRLNGGAGADLLRGGAGGDILNGGAGQEDIVDYRTSAGGVTVDLDDRFGASGGDAEGDLLTNLERVLGSGRADTISGNGIQNLLVGNNGNDTIDGRGGNDTIRGGKGNDTLTGGAGRDTFRFDTFDTNDTITDFEDGVDRIEFVTGPRLSFDDLQIDTSGVDAVVTYTGGTITLLGAGGTIDEPDFIFS